MFLVERLILCEALRAACQRLLRKMMLNEGARESMSYNLILELGNAAQALG